MFQVLSIQRFWKDDASLVRDFRHAGSWFTADALKAQNVLDDDGNVLACTPRPHSVTLVLIDTEGTHEARYSRSGNTLVRTFDGANLTIIDEVNAVSAHFTLCGKMLTFELAVDTDEGDTEMMTLRTFLRRLP